MSGPRLPVASSQLPWGSSVRQEGRYIKVIRALPSVIVLAAFLLVISSARDSRVVIDSETANSVRIDDERIVREIRTYGYIPKTSAMKKQIAACSSFTERAGRRKDNSKLVSHSRIKIARS